MSTNDFFKKMDEKIKSIKAKNESHKINKTKIETFFEKAIQDISTLLEEYEKGLKDRNISCELSIQKTGFSLKMYYPNGDHRSIRFGREIDPKLEFYRFVSSFTNDDGKNYDSTDGVPITEGNWSKELVEKKIQKEIEDFLFYSDRHE